MSKRRTRRSKKCCMTWSAASSKTTSRRQSPSRLEPANFLMRPTIPSPPKTSAQKDKTYGTSKSSSARLCRVEARQLLHGWRRQRPEGRPAESDVRGGQKGLREQQGPRDVETAGRHESRLLLRGDFQRCQKGRRRYGHREVVSQQLAQKLTLHHGGGECRRHGQRSWYHRRCGGSGRKIIPHKKAAPKISVGL